MIGRILLNRYRVLRLLGEGGMSRVYLAQQLDQDRQVAVKVLDPDKVAKPEFQDLLRREVAFLSRFRHPHAVALYDAVLDDPTDSYMVLEYVNGISLGQLLERHGRLTPLRVGRILGQLCAVLHATHKLGLIYRDLKPDNIMLADPDSETESVKVLDLGLAKLANSSGNSLYFSLAEFSGPNRRIVGTPEYLCPEEVRGAAMDHRGDLYSVGIMLFELLTGRRPFDRDTIPEMLEAHASAEPPTFGAFGAPDVPRQVQDVVYCCLRKDPGQRLQTALEVAKRYGEAIGEEIVVHEVVESMTAAVEEACSDLPEYDEHTSVQRLTAWMPERIAIMKIRGCLPSIGGEVAESSPGRLRIDLHRPVQPPRQESSLLGWLGFGKKLPAVAPLAPDHLELRLSNPDPTQPNQLVITVVLRPAGKPDADWHCFRERVVQELCAYLMARKEAAEAGGLVSSVP